MYAKVSKIREKSEHPFFLYEAGEKHPFYANKIAKSLFKPDDAEIDIYKIFKHTTAQPFLFENISEKLKDDDFATMYDIIATTHLGEEKLVDLQIGFADDNHTEIFIEIALKSDVRMKNLKSYIDYSHRPECLLNFDDKLSISYANQNFYDIFDTDKESFSDVYDGKLGTSFTFNTQRSILNTIHETLKTTTNCHVDVQIMSTSGKSKWFYLDLQKRLFSTNSEMLFAMLIPIDDKVIIQNELRDVNRYFDALQDLSDDLLFRVNIRDKKLIRRNNEAQLFGVDAVLEDFPESARNKNVIHPEDIDIYIEYGNKLLQGVGGSTEVRMRQLGGDYEYRRLMCTPVKNEDGIVNEMFGKLVNVQRIKELEEKAKYDTLTKTLNKRAFQEAVNLLINSTKNKERHALFFININDFKIVNENFGHAFGDFLLQTLGIRLNQSIRSGDLVGRVGGDEFVIFLKNAPSNDALIGKAKLLLSSISEEFNDGNSNHVINARIGISTFPDNGLDYEELYHYADLALNNSKENSKNTVNIYKVN